MTPRLLDAPHSRGMTAFEALSVWRNPYSRSAPGTQRRSRAKDLRIDIEHAHDAPSQATVAKQVDCTKFMMRVRNVASAAMIGMIGVHALLAYSPIAKYLPATIVRGLACP